MRTNLFTDKSQQRKKIAVQVRNTHILLLVLVFILVTVMLAIMVNKVITSTSLKFAGAYSSETIEKFNLYVNHDLVLLQKLSRSVDINNWFENEDNPSKKAEAYNELMEYPGLLQSDRLNFVIHNSLNEYVIGSETPVEYFFPSSKIELANSDNDWYFICIRSQYEHTFNVDIDRETGMRHLWINYKVMKGDIPLGVLRSMFSFDAITQSLFTSYDEDIQGYIIDRSGYIQMQSALPDFPPDEKTETSTRIQTLYPEIKFDFAPIPFQNKIDDYFSQPVQPSVHKLPHHFFGYISIASLTGTDWLVVTFFYNNSLYSARNLLPWMIALLFVFFVYTFINNFLLHRLVLTPLDRLTKSLSASNFYIGEIFGCDRNDEIGILAQTVQKMRDRISTYNAELLRAAREREHLIRVDQLTDIPNRRSFDERLPLEWGRAIRTQTPISILILDLDHFKNYNDTYGHLQGDKALQVVAKVFIQELKRSGDIVARWGGEEFAILLSDTDINGAMDIAERIRLKIENLPIPLADDSVSKITASIGVYSLVPTKNDVHEDFIRNADMALYTAKREGRNRVCQYSGRSI